MLDHETEERLGATRRANLRFELSEDQELFRATGEKFLGREYPQSRIRQLAESEHRGFEKSVWRRCYAAPCLVLRMKSFSFITRKREMVPFNF